MTIPSIFHVQKGHCHFFSSYYLYHVVANGFIALVILAIVGLVIAIVTLAGLSAEMCLLGIFHLEKVIFHFPHTYVVRCPMFI